jgi:hypothetical protein
LNGKGKRRSWWSWLNRRKRQRSRRSAWRFLEDFSDQAEPSALAGVLVPALKDQDPRVRKLALERMTDGTDPPLEAMAEMVLRDERAELRNSAIETLVSIHGAAAVPTLEQALSDPSPRGAQRSRAGF